eukprot:5047705-Pyramimonas_sp.AAC.1
MVAALAEIKVLGCDFLVAGRLRSTGKTPRTPSVSLLFIQRRVRRHNIQLSSLVTTFSSPVFSHNI